MELPPELSRRAALECIRLAAQAFDQDYFELLATQSGNTGLVVGQPGDPRTYGITVAHTF